MNFLSLKMKLQYKFMNKVNPSNVKSIRMDSTFSANGKQNVPSFKNSDYEPKIQTNEKIAYTGFLAITRVSMPAMGKEAI